MSKLTSLTLLTVLVGVLVALKLPPRVNLPQHLLGHPAMFVKDFLAPDIAKELMRVAKEEMVEFPTNVADTKFYDPFREHIGEAVPLVNGSCEHPFMTPNKARTACVLAGRIDIGRHFILHGGFGGVKETYERAVSRLQSFGQFIFDADRYPVVSQLFASDKFQSAAKSTCPKERQFLDPFQFNFIVQVPGQTVTIHVDGVYFDHADRFTFPQWFLAAMKMSGLWEDEFVPQIQVVGYFHEWDWSPARSGEFVYWDENGPAKRLPPLPRAASVVDGSKVVHSATIYRPDDMPPILDKSKSHTLKYVGDERWELRTEGETRRNYTTDDLRWTIVYRAKCFKDEAARDAFNAMKVEEKHSLESILAKFIKDLVKRGKLSNEQQGWDMDRLQLGVLIMDTYIHYPLPETAWIPYNYCALSRLFSWTAPLLRPFCE